MSSQLRDSHMLHIILLHQRYRRPREAIRIVQTTCLKEIKMPRLIQKQYRPLWLQEKPLIQMKLLTLTTSSLKAVKGPSIAKTVNKAKPPGFISILTRI